MKFVCKEYDVKKIYNVFQDSFALCVMNCFAALHVIIDLYKMTLRHISACGEWPMSRQAKLGCSEPRTMAKKIFCQIFPPFCCACKCLLQDRKALCSTCALKIRPLASTAVEVTQKYSMRVFCVGAYEEPLRQFVLAKSYSDHLACYYMAQLIYERSLFSKLEVDYIVPVPLHWRRYAKRGYNQSEEIAKYLSQFSGIPVKSLVRRTKATEFQSRCDKDARHQNVKGVFELAISADERDALCGKKFLLVDDVMTTGATLVSSGKVLASLRPTELFACVLART